MKRHSTSVTSPATGSSIIPINVWADNYSVGLYLKFAGTSNVDVQVTSDDLKDGTPTNWWGLTNWTGLTANKAGLLDFPATAIRILRNSGTDATTLVVIESP